MAPTATDPTATLWLVDGTPTRLVYAGRRWRVTDTPTHLEGPGWSAPLEPHEPAAGWRLQATDTAGASFVFDVYRVGDAWHVHRSYG
ncbi:hypothetical protein MTES_0171 [Microbacterium testaceum StLB037]|uniref:Uncharacterized protein n=1 Tax=Microbacterium testaceum (strain StLB037) TaxID=979556 RepID=E8N8S6_MICTS|nr:hypothetical protein [Microbacterium testaceum]BAJ73135.1 hypothetical protein MTES_0171 [Microbacterium testaceum StLB037]